MPVHPARPGEIMQVLWSDYYSAVVFGERGEIACLPHNGCWLEVVATVPTWHRTVNLPAARRGHWVQTFSLVRRSR